MRTVRRGRLCGPSASLVREGSAEGTTDESQEWIRVGGTGRLTKANRLNCGPTPKREQHRGAGAIPPSPHSNQPALSLRKSKRLLRDKASADYVPAQPPL
jgi:hypothetical protein